MNDTAQAAVIQEHCKELKLAAVIRDYPALCRQARDGGWAYERYECRSTIVTSNLAFSEWVKVFADEKLTTALLDRLTHHAHILTTRGESYRASKRKADADNRSPPSNNKKE
jgi:IstB-like ATP binding protein